MRLVGICGLTRAGKSTLARELRGYVYIHSLLFHLIGTRKTGESVAEDIVRVYLENRTKSMAPVFRERFLFPKVIDGLREQPEVPPRVELVRYALQTIADAFESPLVMEGEVLNKRLVRKFYDLVCSVEWAVLVAVPEKIYVRSAAQCNEKNVPLIFRCPRTVEAAQRGLIRSFDSTERVVMGKYTQLRDHFQREDAQWL